MPIVQTRLALNVLKAGDDLVIYADDPTFSEEFKRFCYLADITLISKEKTETYDIYTVKVLK